jgi:hypothetical protein
MVCVPYSGRRASTAGTLFRRLWGNEAGRTNRPRLANLLRCQRPRRWCPKQIGFVADLL